MTVILLHIEPREGNERCPYCFASPEDRELWTCPGCATVHHEDCARDHGGCVVYACETKFVGPGPVPRSRRIIPRPSLPIRRAPRDDSVLAAIVVTVIVLLCASEFTTSLRKLPEDYHEKSTRAVDDHVMKKIR